MSQNDADGQASDHDGLKLNNRKLNQTTNGDFSRRRFLQVAGLTGLTIGGLGNAAKSSAQENAEEATRYNIRYSSEDGKEQAMEISEGVHYDLNPIDFITIEATPDQAEELRDDEEIDLVEEDIREEIIPEEEVLQTESLANGQVTPWGIDRIGAPTAHEAGLTGDGVAVAVIDSGVDATHPDLQENLGEGAAAVLCQGNCTEPWDDDRGHGTHVAGTIGAINNDIGVIGVSPDVTIHSIKVTQSGIGFVSDIAAGIVFAAQEGYDVANMSFGGSTPSPLREDAITFASEQGVLLVAAAMNDSGPVSFPAAYPEVIAVSATTEGDTLADYSNYGPEIELAAPGGSSPPQAGRGILSTLPPNVDLNPTSNLYGELPGTSMAAPHVSGVGALLIAQGFSAEEARQFMNDTAEDIGLPPEEQGAGLINAAAAVQEAPCPKNRKEKKKNKYRKDNSEEEWQKRAFKA